MAQVVDEKAASAAIKRIQHAGRVMRAAEAARHEAQVERARAIQDAVSAGLSKRELARRLGLSHERVRQMAAWLEK